MAKISTASDDGFRFWLILATIGFCTGNLVFAWICVGVAILTAATA